MLSWIRTLVNNYRQNVLQEKWKEVIEKEKSVWGETFYYVFSQGFNAGKVDITFEEAWQRIETVLGIKYKPKEVKDGKEKSA